MILYKYTQMATGIPLAHYVYMPSDIKIENNAIIFTNPRFSYIVETRLYIDVFIDLGRFVTNTGVHIPDNSDNYGYRFLGTTVQPRDLLNWSIFSRSAADYYTETRVLDYMYSLPTNTTK